MQLAHLELDSCQLTQVPPCVASMAGLQSLNLRNNRTLRALPTGPYQRHLTCLDVGLDGQLDPV